jgi:hypothetical protein
VEIASTAGKRQPPRKGRSQLSKSFLLLFFKKEDLPVFLLQKSGGPEGPPSLGRKRPRRRRGLSGAADTFTIANPPSRQAKMLRRNKS